MPKLEWALPGRFHRSNVSACTCGFELYFWGRQKEDLLNELRRVRDHSDSSDSSGGLATSLLAGLVNLMMRASSSVSSWFKLLRLEVVHRNRLLHWSLLHGFHNDILHAHVGARIDAHVLLERRYWRDRCVADDGGFWPPESPVMAPCNDSSRSCGRRWHLVVNIK